MSDEDLVTVMTFGTPQEATIAQGFLANHDIPAFIQGGESVTTLFYVGTALGGVKLQVPKSQSQRARKLLTQEFDSSGSVPAWKCRNCQNDNDAGFEICWSCGGKYRGPTKKKEQPKRKRKKKKKQSTLSPDLPEPEPQEFEGDVYADRAFRSAVFGMIFCPLHLLACFHIIAAIGYEFSPRGLKKLLGAVFIVAVYFLSAVLILKVLYP